MNIKGIVKDLVNKYNTNNVYELCDFLNIKIRKDTLGSIKGYFLNPGDKICITLNDNLQEWEERVVIAHELGHAILHKKYNICFLNNYTYSISNKLENEANEFAAHLLIDDDELNKLKIEYEHYYLTFEHLSMYFNVPEEYIMYKIKE